MTSEKADTRRRYSMATKAQVVAQCAEPGASVAKIAMAHGINANVVHRWRKLARGGDAKAATKTGEFIALPLTMACAPAPPSQPYMRAGTESVLGRVVKVFGEARPHHAYLFANRRANRMKALVHDGIGVWLAARRLNAGRFVWPQDGNTLALTRSQLEALVLGLPWQRIGEAGVIRIL